MRPKNRLDLDPNQATFTTLNDAYADNEPHRRCQMLIAAAKSPTICARSRRVLERMVNRSALPAPEYDGQGHPLCSGSVGVAEGLSPGSAGEMENNWSKTQYGLPPLEKRIGSSSKMPDAGERGAVIYSIIVSCLRHSIKPYSCLRDLLDTVTIYD